MDNFFKKDEELLDEYLRQNKTEVAVRLLFDLISRYAGKKNFIRAEALREKLFEVDPMALSEIIRSGEIIEEEKSESIDQDHLGIWSDLYDSLSTDEANTLYLAMENSTYDIEDVVFRQGNLNSMLCFVNQGQLKISYTQGEREILLKTIGPGDVAGEDTFFSITVCTTSLVTLSRVKLSFLKKDTFIKWQNDLPLLASKLNDYCSLRTGNIRDVFEKKGLERRSHKRIRMSGIAEFQLLSASGDSIGKAYKGNISDVSVGGLSFDVKMSKKNALLLLARKLNVKFPIPKGKPRMKVKRKGVIIGVTKASSDAYYTIRTKFDNILKELQEKEDEWLKTSI